MRSAIERANNAANHNYSWSKLCRVHICAKCGTAEHRSGWYYWAGYKSKSEPPCYGIKGIEEALIKWQEKAIFEGL
ncbi:hypothetical protein ID853_13600 [Xenorhabdus sp. Vera]|uniref:hypothetical protein n=1 Tax=Xenorhabdus koppenhoeferi TaxID=351659 RepID=UPI0019AC0E98|nr:hypothetical protein [Xenorhabdus sp. Vera]MBD2811895.1 hypothetical protein [Xenorhabdus sp. Vera]